MSNTERKKDGEIGEGDTDNITITEHSVNKYIERILGGDYEEVDDELRKWCRGEILKVVMGPDKIKHNEEDMAQIQIRKGVAVPVGKVITEEKLGPYKNLSSDKIIIPTCYEAKTFEGDKYKT